MTIGRRFLFQAASLAPLAAITPARANTTDLVVACDLTLGPALEAAGAAFRARNGVRIRVFPTAPGLLLPQLVHQVQNDILATRADRMDAAARQGLLTGPRIGAWRNRLVLAGLQATPPSALTEGPIAVPDPTPAFDLDGPAVLARLGLHARTIGAINTEEVVALLADGTARAGLLYATDVRSDSRLHVLGAVADDATPPIVYSAAVTRNSWRPNPLAFTAFLATPDAAAIFTAQGLETSA